ncbi:MAG: tRNA wybutosine-synthesizing 3 family protein [Nanoarchaeota archaeon]
MVFQNEKKTYLAKIDKSKKGNVDEKIIPLVSLINSKDNYYTTSSCSGRVCLWKGNGKKNETEWIKVSHNLIGNDFIGNDFIRNDFLAINDENLVWLRLEPFILHVACRDITSGNALLQKAKQIYKKSSLLSVSNKIVVEIRGSEFMEMPLYENRKLLFSGDMQWLAGLLNKKMKQIWKGTSKFQRIIEEFN